MGEDRGLLWLQAGLARRSRGSSPVRQRPWTLPRRCAKQRQTTGGARPRVRVLAQHRHDNRPEDPNCCKRLQPDCSNRWGKPKDRKMSDLTVEPVTSFRVRRLTVPIPGVRIFQARYERAVPNLPIDRVKELVASGAPWSAMVEMIDAAAPHGFLIYFKNDVHAVMVSAGDTADCVAYLMGNHVIAEKMFRHDPRAMLYAPLRTLIWEDPARPCLVHRGSAQYPVREPWDSRGGKGRRRARPQAGLALRGARSPGTCPACRPSGRVQRPRDLNICLRTR